LVQVPSVPASAHDLQVAVQAAEQQTLCAQMPLAQSVAAAQAAPLGRFVQTPPEQMLGDTQSPSTVQVVRQAPVPHTKGSHRDVVASWQVPVPLHERPDVSVDPVQLGATHGVPATYSRQAPAPLQVPSLAQPAAPASAHWFSGSWPLGTLVHVPSVPAMAQERQVPVQALPQQIPCSQKPELHWAGVVQVAPTGSSPQLAPLHVLGDAQSAVVAQVVRQAPVPHA
jgi:hypothetical protein